MKKEDKMKSQELLNANPPFPICTDRADYKKQTGLIAPEFDSSKPLKFWWDAMAEEEADGLPEVVYQNNVMVKPDGTWALRNGAPATKPLVLTVEDALNVNLPPEDPTGRSVVPAGHKQIPCPFRDLGPDEVLAIAGAEMGFLSGKVIVIRNNKLFAEEMAQQAEDSGKFTGSDRAMLKAIAAKLGLEG